MKAKEIRKLFLFVLTVIFTSSILLTYSVNADIVHTEINGGFILGIDPPDPNAVVITTAEELANIGKSTSTSFVLGNDIDLSTYNNGIWNPIGTYQLPFNGVLDGAGHVIKNLNIPSSNSLYAGLFGVIHSGQIKNVGVEVKDGGVVESSYNNGRAAGLVAYVDSSITINNCYVKGNIKADNAGGLVGQGDNTSMNIDSSYVDGYISGENNSAFSESLGGLIGGNYTNPISISNSFTKGNISADHDGSNVYIGGLIGNVSWSQVTAKNSNSQMNISSNYYNSSTIYAGGLFGKTLGDATIDSSYSTGNVEAYSSRFAYSGGIIGSAGCYGQTTNITNSYSTGNITAISNNSAFSGGLIGGDIDATYPTSSKVNINGSHSTGDISGSSSTSIAYLGGLVGGARIAYFTNSYSSGRVLETKPSAKLYIGGLLGYCETLINNNSSSMGSVKSLSTVAYSGGLTGFCNLGAFQGTNYYAGSINAAGGSAEQLVGIVNIIQVDVLSDLNLCKGSQTSLNVTIKSNGNVISKPLNYVSKNQDIATVSGDGLITAKAPGKTEIDITIGDNEYTTKCYVNVTIPLIGISLDKTQLTLEKGETAKLNVIFNPIDTTDSKDIIWSSSDNNIVSLDITGTLNAVGVGKATITANVGGKTASCIVTSMPHLDDLSSDSYTNKVGDNIHVVASFSDPVSKNIRITFNGAINNEQFTMSEVSGSNGAKYELYYRSKPGQSGSVDAALDVVDLNGNETIHTKKNIFNIVSKNVDLNMDGQVNIMDLALVAKSYNVKTDNSIYNINLDLNEDGIIDLFDLVYLSKYIK